MYDMSPSPLLPTLADPSSGLPVLGIGTYELRGDDCVKVVSAALQLGVRLIDTAACYRNEELVGQGIVLSGVPREDIFVVVKIAMKSMRTVERLRAGIEDSLRKLGIGYADCLLMHWPGCAGVRADDVAAQSAARRRCWGVMQEFYHAGRARRIGVSNFQTSHFADVQPACAAQATQAPSCDRTASAPNTSPPLMNVLPHLNQIELHPLCVQAEVVSYCRARGIALQQYSPLGKGDDRLLRHSELARIQATHFPNYSVVDLLLMWGLSQGFCTLVRSRSVAHVRANWNVAMHFFGRAVTREDGVCGGEAVREPLTSEQREIIHNLREHMHVTEDVHLCWDSATIA